MTMTVSAIYRGSEGATFDFDRYAEHLTLVRERWAAAGLTGIDAYRGVSDPVGAAAPVVAVALLHFASAEAMQAALTGEHFAEIQSDIVSFTTIQPELQVNAPL